MKKKFTPDFNTALEIAEKYGLSCDNINTALSEIPDFKVTVPVIGGFSTGKSSLINAVIGEQLLSTNITPETAVPAEITYGNDTAVLVSKSGEESAMPLSEFDSKQLAADKYSLVKIQSSNPFFAEIPSIKLVDMPGFDSGIEVHNKAIDNYLPASLAYILTVAADEGTLRESIISFLNELKLYKLPVYTVITKANKADPQEIDSLREHIVETVSRFLKIDNPKVAVTTAKGKATDTDGFKNFLIELQNDSDEIFNRYFSARLDSECAVIEKYLSDRLAQRDMSLEDIEFEKKQTEHSISELSRQIETEQSSFEQQMRDCVSRIQSAIQSRLNANKQAIEALLLQGGDVGAKVNSIIRNAITEGMQSDVEPRIHKYIVKISGMIDAQVFGAQIATSDNGVDAGEVSSKVKDIVVPLATTLSVTAINAFAGTALATTLGLTGSILGPVGIAVGALVGIGISGLIGSGIKKKQEEERKNQARAKAAEIINSVSAEACSKVESKIMEYIGELNQSIAEDVAQKRALLEKSLADTEEKLRLGTAEKELEKAALTADLETIRGIRNGI